jgi:hypothetical protein
VSTSGTARAPDAVAEPRGFALAAAVLALLVLSALAAGAFFAAFEEARIGRNGRAAESAFEAAEAGLSRALSDGPPGGWGGMPVGDSSPFSGTLPAGTGRFSGACLRLNDQLFLVRSAGVDATGEAQRSVAALARLEPVAGSLQGALTAGGRVALGGASFLDGRDTEPPGWSGCPAVGRSAIPGLALPGMGDLQDAACGTGCIAGEPPVQTDAALHDSVPLRVGSADWSALERAADKTYPAGGPGLVVVPSPVPAGSACDRSARDNWGEPGRPPTVAACTGYHPVILVQGDLTIAGGRGQGALLVNGDLLLTGATEFDGLVLVRGSLRAVGTGGRIRGGVVVANAGGGLAASLERVRINFSGCALEAALRPAARARPLPERSWSELF